MQLDPIVDNFLKHNAPSWHQKITGDGDMSELKHYNCCVVGEIHKWSNGYAPRLLSTRMPSESKYCRFCTKYSVKIFRATHRSQVAEDAKPVKRPGVARQRKLNDAIKELAEHVKKAHPELLRQEKPIETI